jgi:hypothetical protein
MKITLKQYLDFLHMKVKIYDSLIIELIEECIPKKKKRR